MGGPNTAPSQQIEQQQLNLSEKQQDQAQVNYDKMQKLLQPAISYNSKIASGSRGDLLTALAPQLANISQGKAQAKGQIMEQVGPGAARDVALAQNDISAAGQAASLKNSSFTSALDKLANIGSGLGSFSLNETGAALSGLSGAGNTANTVMQAQNASKASTMGFLGELAGAGGAVGAAKLSDIRLKSNIREVGKVGPLSIYEYDMRGKPEREVGFIAQEVAQVFPDAVVVGGDDENKRPWMVNYPSVLAKMALMQAA